jgi:hypothetical protein
VVKNNDGAEFRETVSVTKRPIYDPHGGHIKIGKACFNRLKVVVFLSDSFEAQDIIPTKTTTVLVKSVAQVSSLVSPSPQELYRNPFFSR